MKNNSRAELFVDSAELATVERWLRRGATGITTNPTIIAKELFGDRTDEIEPAERRALVFSQLENLLTLVNSIGKDVDSIIPVSIQLTRQLPPEMMVQAEQYQLLGNQHRFIQIVVKVPFASSKLNYLEVIRDLAQAGYSINATCLMSAWQATECLRAGADYVSLFAGRITKSGGSPWYEIETTRKRISQEKGEDTAKIIVGSIRHPLDVDKAWSAGAHIVTVPKAVLAELPDWWDHDRTKSTTDEMFASASELGFD